VHVAAKEDLWKLERLKLILVEVELEIKLKVPVVPLPGASRGDDNYFEDDTFFHHYQGSIDFNTVNIHRTVGMYFWVSSGNRGDIE
jgi:hypothetical protein